MHKEFENNMEALIRAKRFDQLTAEEQAIVLERISEKEYQQFRLILCGTKNRLNPVLTQPSPQVKNNLMAAMRERQKRRRPLIAFMTTVGNAQIPLWQAAAALAGLLFLAFFGRGHILTNPDSGRWDSGQVVFVDTVYETKYDTVYREIRVNDKPEKKVNIRPDKNTFDQETEPARQQSNAKILEKTGMLHDSDGFYNEVPLLADTTLPHSVEGVKTSTLNIRPQNTAGQSPKDHRTSDLFFRAIH